MNTSDDVIAILSEILGLDPSRKSLDRHTRLLGALPEFDSMAVVSVLTAVEERFDIMVEDHEVDASIFETVGTLTAFIDAKLAA